jgi:adenylate kinase
MRLVFLGPPGVGKGTQAQMLAQQADLLHLSTGDMLREAVAAHTEVGLNAKQYMDRGELVPDGVIIALVRDRVQRPDCGKGFILDGFPRTIPQAEALDGMLAELTMPLGGVVAFTVSEDELVRRLGGRRTCGCGASYHVVNKPPKSEGVCDKCGASLIVREDDQPDAIRRRLQVYKEKTEPLIAYYRGTGILKEVDAAAGMDEVRASVSRSLGL